MNTEPTGRTAQLIRDLERDIARLAGCGVLAGTENALAMTLEDNTDQRIERLTSLLDRLMLDQRLLEPLPLDPDLR